MRRFLKLTLRITGIFFELLGSVITIYIAVFLLVAPFTVEKKSTKEKATEVVYLSSNGIHTDLILPIHHPQMDWSKELNLKNDLMIDTFQTHLKFGWGDKNFFMKTKDWSDLTLGTAIQTTFGKGPGAMHLVLCTPKDLDKTTLITLRLTKHQYHELCSFVRNSFLWKDKTAVRITKHPYGKWDFFFDSSLDYSMLYTCNTWTNNGLISGGQKACFWTPFKDPIYAKYK